MEIKMATKTEFIAARTESRFKDTYREFLAHFSADGVFESLVSYLQLNFDSNELLSAQSDPNKYFRIVEQALVTLYDRQAIVPITEFNEVAQKDLVKLRRATGIGAEDLPAPPPPPPTADELLRQEITNDWRTLSSDKIRQKRNGNRQYGLMLDRMANEGALDSAVTSIQRLGQ
jgi:hypothetical protein